MSASRLVRQLELYASVQAAAGVGRIGRRIGSWDVLPQAPGDTMRLWALAISRQVPRSVPVFGVLSCCLLSGTA